MLRTITVKGTGRVSIRPDYVVLSLDLEAKNIEYDKAMAIAAKQLSELNDTLASIGFEKGAIKTTNFDVRTEYNSYRDKDDNYQRLFCGFTCQHQLKLSFDFDMKRLAETLEAISHCSAQPELSINFTVKDGDAVSEKLLQEATVNARQKAKLLCEASGTKLGQLVTISYNWSELNISSNTQFGMVKQCMQSVPTIEIEPDDIDVRDTATFIWEIE